MSDERWTRVGEVFDAVVELPPERRDAALDDACGDDPAVRAGVERLLRAHDDDASRVRGVVDRALAVGEAQATGREGSQAGPYTLDRRLGEGGMGSVWLARRSDDVHAAEVAVKIVRGSVSDEEAMRRFRSERHILAELNHPGIARLLDGGVTDDGAPYFVMEYVDGVPIDVHCETARLSTRETLELFREVCDAVRYAHGRLVVHRDLKPGNILVTPSGRPKLLDFGIAKLLADDADAGLTRTGFRPMTPRYASPEQIRGTAITTATDVYTLGVVLYELLTGVLPHSDAAGANRDLEDAILSRTPPAPSVALTTVDGARTTDGGTRDATARRLRGDLDTIVLKALQKDPARRYASVEELSEDVGRHLSGLPVRARPDTLSYRTGKFVRRHRGSVLAGTIAFLVITGLAVSSAWQAVQLRRERDALQVERDKATAVADFLVGVFQAADPDESLGADVTARQILTAGAARAREGLADPAVRWAVMGAIGRVYRDLAEFPPADTLLTDLVDETRAQAGAGSLDHAKALLALAELRRYEDRMDEAEVSAREALDIMVEALGPDHPETATAWLVLGWILSARGQHAQAEAPLERAWRIRSAWADDTDETNLRAMHGLSGLYLHVGRAEDALRMGERHLAALQTVRARDDTEVAAARYAVGAALSLAGRTEEAAEQLQTAAETLLRVLPENHPDHIPATSGLAVVLSQLGRFDEASSWADQSVRIARTLDQPMMLGQALINAAAIAMGAGKLEEAAAMSTEAAAALAEGGGSDNALRGLALANSGYALHRLGDLEGAERRLQEALQVVRAGGPASSRFLALALSYYAGVLLDLGRVDEAAPMLAEARPIWETAVGPNHGDRLRYDTLLARLHLARGEREEARVLLEDVAARAEAAGVDYEEVRTLLREASGEDGPG